MLLRENESSVFALALKGIICNEHSKMATTVIDNNACSCHSCLLLTKLYGIGSDATLRNEST